MHRFDVCWKHLSSIGAHTSSYCFCLTSAHISLVRAISDILLIRGRANSRLELFVVDPQWRMVGEVRLGTYEWYKPWSGPYASGDSTTHSKLACSRFYVYH